uniref:Uncharacterized protein n=1 Tax=Triticum urartu TaxID=4572 RepID=A0A8R7QIW8_TRIUA
MYSSRWSPCCLGHELIHQGCWQPPKWSIDINTGRIVGCGHHLHQAPHIRPSRAHTQGEYTSPFALHIAWLCMTVDGCSKRLY